MVLVVLEKLFVRQCLIHTCTAQLGKEVVPVAWTGIVATLLPRGHAVHSRFKLPLNLHEHSVSGLRMNKQALFFQLNSFGMEHPRQISIL